MEEGAAGAREGPTPARPDPAPTSSVLYSQALRSLMGGECLQILRCSICMEFFNIPIVLPCGHTFCLQCLTEMCRHATRSRAQNPLKELLIGCPNCRVQIFAKPILERNVTCNFIIQSLIDMLRNKKITDTHDACVNTERSLVGDPVRAVSKDVLCGVLRDVDRLTKALNSRSVVDDAFFEIESLRRQYADFQPAKLSSESVVTASAGAETGSGVKLTVPSSTLAASGASPLNSPTTSCTGFQPRSQTTVTRRAYALAVASRPNALTMPRAHLPSGTPNQCRPGFRNKNRNNADVAGGSPPEVATSGDGAHCIAKIFPEVTACVLKRHTNARAIVSTWEKPSEMCSCSNTLNSPPSSRNKNKHCSFDFVQPCVQSVLSASSMALKKRLARKRTDTQSANSAEPRLDTENVCACSAASCPESQISPKKAKSPDTSSHRKDIAKQNRLRLRKSHSGKRYGSRSRERCTPDLEDCNLTLFLDGDREGLDDDETQISPLAPMFLNLSVGSREC